jgi:hypothetical protein
VRAIFVYIITPVVVVIDDVNEDEKHFFVEIH